MMIYFMFSVERLFYDLMKSGHPALDPLVITPNGMLSIKDDVLKSPQQLCTLLHGHRYSGARERFTKRKYM